MTRAACAIAIALGFGAAARAEAAACDSNLMIVLDRSCSMNKSPGGGEPRTKWDIAVDAIGQLTTAYAGQLRFGLIMFPDEDGANCVQDGPIYVPVGDDTGAAVVAALEATQPTGPCVTNIDTAVAQVSADPAFDGTPDPSGRRGFALLITDGKQSGSCGGNGADPTTIANLEALYAAGYPTYVVGFGGGVDPDDLAAFAAAGGVPRAGDPPYYQADDAAALAEALDAIAGDIVGDPELGGCAGTPCPDGRCFGDGERCVDGVCVVDRPDAGPTPDAGAADGGGADGGGGAAAGDGDGGCGCRAGGRTPAGPTGAMALAALVALARFRRRGSPRRA
ncbi:MAG: VWA domain-containing protein [Deltaproteobacteria bacterium]|nr:MAG: VWA domain-containing protein [Deltaproteobacteria bacterium]